MLDGVESLTESNICRLYRPISKNLIRLHANVCVVIFAYNQKNPFCIRTCRLTVCIHPLILITLWANSADDKLMIIFLFSQKTGFDISCKLSPMETICMKCQILFFSVLFF